MEASELKGDADVRARLDLEFCPLGFLRLEVCRHAGFDGPVCDGNRGLQKKTAADPFEAIPEPKRCE